MNELDLPGTRQWAPPSPAPETPEARMRTRPAGTNPAGPEGRIAIRWQRRIVIVPIASIVRLEACDNHVLVCADQIYRHRETLANLCAFLPEGTMLRVHRSHAISVGAVRELLPRPHGEYALVLRDGSVVITGRHFRVPVETAFGLTLAPPVTN